jgi:hypothetical protein
VRRCFEKATARAARRRAARALRLSNDECEAIDGTLTGLHPLTADAPPSVAALKRFLARPTADASRKLLAAMAAGGDLDADRAPRAGAADGVGADGVRPAAADHRATT